MHNDITQFIILFAMLLITIYFHLQPLFPYICLVYVALFPLLCDVVIKPFWQSHKSFIHKIFRVFFYSLLCAPTSKQATEWRTQTKFENKLLKKKAKFSINHFQKCTIVFLGGFQSYVWMYVPTKLFFVNLFFFFLWKPILVHK